MGELDRPSRGRFVTRATTVRRSPSSTAMPRDRSRVVTCSRSSSWPATPCSSRYQPGTEHPSACTSWWSSAVTVTLPRRSRRSARGACDVAVRCGRSARSLVISAMRVRRGPPGRPDGHLGAVAPTRRAGGAPVPSSSTSATSGSRRCSSRNPAANSRPSKVSSTTRVIGRAGPTSKPARSKASITAVRGRSGWVKVVGIVVGLRTLAVAERGLVGAGHLRAVGWSSMIEAAGGVVWKVTPKGVVKVLLVHRPRYDDWSFPKGKLDPGERHRPGGSP